MLLDDEEDEPGRRTRGRRIEELLRAGIGNAGDGQAVAALEAAHGAIGIAAEVAVRRTAEVAKRFQSALKRHNIGVIAIGAGKRIIAVRRIAGSRLRLRRIEQLLRRAIGLARNSQSVDRLEPAHGALRAAAEDTIHTDGIIAQILETLLERVNERHAAIAAHQRRIRLAALLIADCADRVEFFLRQLAGMPSTLRPLADWNSRTAETTLSL